MDDIVTIDWLGVFVCLIVGSIIIWTCYVNDEKEGLYTEHAYNDGPVPNLVVWIADRFGGCLFLFACLAAIYWVFIPNMMTDQTNEFRAFLLQ